MRASSDPRASHTLSYRRSAIGSHGSELTPFSQTLPRFHRRLAGRIEGFGDIVFGFAVSQCALQLPTHLGHVEMSHPLALLLYVGTFALIASLWLNFHRLMSGAFVPAGIDLFLAFAYLALVSLFPFALYDVSHATQTLALARSAVAQYTALYAIMSAIAAVLVMRNLRRGYHVEDGVDRDRAWVGFMRNCALTGLMAIALVVDLTLGPTPSCIVYPFIAVAINVSRRRYPHAPSARALRLPAPAG